MKVEMRTVDLLAKVRENLENHKAEYEAAYAAWLQEQAEYHQKMARAYRTGVKPRQPRPGYEPTSHEEEYLLAISMLEVQAEAQDEKGTTALDSKSYSRLVMDNWDWTDGFKLSTSHYLEKGQF